MTGLGGLSVSLPCPLLAKSNTVPACKRNGSRISFSPSRAGHNKGKCGPGGSKEITGKKGINDVKHYMHY